MNFEQYDRVRPLIWQSGPNLQILDQRVLPQQQRYLSCQTSDEVAEAISNLAVRGAPAIGIAGAYGFVMAALATKAILGREALLLISEQIERLVNSRPTAVNLRWAIERMNHCLSDAKTDWRVLIEQEAIAIQTEDLAANRTMSLLGVEYLTQDTRVLTHCNTGSLATAGFGTALGVIRAGVATGKISQVYASETRPWLQGSRLTIWELLEDGIPATLIVDSASAYLMQQGKIDFVIVGADRICANGDVANKIGTYAHALAAKAHAVKVMVVAPSSTIDMHTLSGAEIAIEQRSAMELTHIGGLEVGAKAQAVYNPVFDVTPASCIDYLVTEKGVIEHPNLAKMQAFFMRK